MTHIDIVAKELQIKDKQVGATIQLLDEGGTIPFISRYRKEITGSLDEVAVMQIRDRINQLRELDKRKTAILKSIDEQGKLIPALRTKIDQASTLTQLEDLYLPYKPKRRTRATIAREKGIEPLAKLIIDQQDIDLHAKASKFINSEKEVSNAEEALQGARDIIAEWISEDQDVRTGMRDLFLNKASFQSKVIRGKEETGAKFKDYFDWEEPVKTAPSHRVLAMRRGEKEMILLLNISPPEEDALRLIDKKWLKGKSETTQQVEAAIRDSYKRLLKPSIENDIRLTTKRKADEEAIEVFSENLRELMMSAPMGEKNILALDPGFRTGCKLVCLNRQGRLLENTTIYPNAPQQKKEASEKTILSLCNKHKIEAIAIGNGTASRETESFIKTIQQLPKHIQVVMVNESGASIYSASEAARDEFPNHDVTVRGAVSIGRRLMDPLAELVKIDAKSIGVGQYQHDVDQSALRQGLDDTVISCVNNVGVEVNTASKQLLTYVSGLGPTLAQNIVDYRNTKGPFKNREELLEIPRLGAKAYEQAAGFLRIRDGQNLLDASAVHPERYNTVNKMANDLGCTINDLMKDQSLREQIDIKQYQSQEIGLPTLKDILGELSKPGRDPRDKYEAFEFAKEIHEIEDLKIGMKIPGIVTNVTNFGAFVDIGVHQDGLVHISHLANKFVDNPSNIVKVHQKVEVTVIDLDITRKRIALSMKADPFNSSKKNNLKPKLSKANTERNTKDDMQDKLKMLKNKFT